MAADTAQKRYSAYDLTLPWRGVRVLPTGAVDAGARAAAMFLYSGIPGGGGGGPAVVNEWLARARRRQRR